MNMYEYVKRKRSESQRAYNRKYRETYKQKYLDIHTQIERTEENQPLIEYLENLPNKSKGIQELLIDAIQRKLKGGESNEGK